METCCLRASLPQFRTIIATLSVCVLIFDSSVSRPNFSFSAAARETPAEPASTAEYRHHEDSTRTNVTFLAFLPCLHEGSIVSESILSSSSGISRSTVLEECDLLSRAAISLAVERVNSDQSILINRTLGVASLPSQHHGHDEESIIFQLQDIVKAFRFTHPNNLFGVIGPQSVAEAKFWAPVFQNADLLTISYDVTNTGPDHIPSFYRTLPSDHEANIGRLTLMAKFQWYRIAVINSNETYFEEVGKDFLSMYSEFVRQYDSREIYFQTSFTDSPDSALSEILLRDIKIIFGFFGESNARKVLCRANSLGLVSEDHAWILPSYYNPFWWRVDNESLLTNKDCSNKELEDILESVIFIQSVKLPPYDMGLDEFHSRLMDEALEILPFVTKDDLKPYLFRSRATSAYDAVILLARSVNFVVSQDSDKDNSNRHNTIHSVLEKLVMYCEYCRLNSECFLNLTETEDCQDMCGYDYRPNATLEQLRNVSSISLDNIDKGLRSQHLLNEFGQILYSQFISGEECPVGLLWHSGHGPNLDHFSTLEELHRVPCAVRLNVSAQNFVKEGSECPLTFQWRGSTYPDSNTFTTYKISVFEIVLISCLTLVGAITAVVLLVFNIHWRNNKSVKGTSPWLNVVILVGVMIRLPAVFFESLSVSAAGYSFNEQLILPLCYFTDLTNFIGEGIFLAALLMKNWRIYRLFHNKKLKRLTGLTDCRLIIGVLVLQVPLATFFLVKAAFFHIRLSSTQLQNRKLQYVLLSFCTSDSEDIFDIAVFSYNTVLLLALQLLAFLNSLVHLPTFRREGVYSLKAAAIVFFPLTVCTVARYLLIYIGEFQIYYIRVIIWMEVTLDVLLPVLTMIVLFIPSVWLVIKSGNTISVKSKTVQISHYDSLLKEREALKANLNSLEIQIADLMEKLSKKSSPS